MPTVPSGELAEQAEPTQAPHHARDVAESFGADPARYDRTRTRYSPALTDWVIARLPGRDVLDVGIGTGVSARPFREAGCRVLGVEADQRMARFARAEGFDVDVSRFEEWDPAGRTFDAIVAGMTWHWIDPKVGPIRAAEALTPGGSLAVFWNVLQPPTELARAFSDVYRAVLPGTPFTRTPTASLDAYEPILRGATDGIVASGQFEKPVRWSADARLLFSTAEWLDLVPTFGGHSTLPRSTRDALLTGLGREIDAAGGTFTAIHRTTAVAATTRTDRERERSR